MFSELKQLQLSLNPIDSFLKWFELAEQAEVDPSAFCLSTSSSDGDVSSRFLLYKGIINNCFTFYSHTHGVKGAQLNSNPRASMAFYWPHLGKQIRITGNVELMNQQDSEKYFRSRARESQAASYVSKQSSKLDSYEELMSEYRNCLESNEVIPYPENWRGYLLSPNYFEFFSYGEHRLNHRICFELVNGRWNKPYRLYP